jgi:tRNA dimethylallyltransferase
VLSLAVAEQTPSEIVSADSRQVYRYMDIGTAKPSLLERGSVPHHCVDIVDPDEPFSAGQYGLAARKAVAEIFGRGKKPVVVGGSGLYIQALVDGLFSGPFRNPEIRSRLKNEAETAGVEALYQRLSGIDPEAAARIHPNDTKRIVRALEVYEISGRPISYIQKEKTHPIEYPVAFTGLLWPRQILNARIEKRVDCMIREGLIEEVRRLRDRNFGLHLNSMDSVGYKEVFLFLNGEISRNEMVAQIKKNTRRFAKRQMTWFRRNPRIRWVSMEEPVHWDELARHILAVDTVVE